MALEELILITILVIPAIIFLVIMMRRRRYNVSVEIFMKTPSGYILEYDRAMRKVHKGTGYVEGKLLKKKDNLKPEVFENIFYKKGKKHLKLISASPGEYQTLKIDSSSLKVIGDDLRQWYIMEREWAERAFQKKQDTLSRLLPVAMVLVVAIAMMLLFVGYSYFISEGGKTLLDATQALNSAAGALREAAQGAAIISQNPEGLVSAPPG